MTVSRFGVVDLTALPEDLGTRIGAIAERSGFVPNIFLALGHRPDELRAFMDYHDALMDSDDGLSKAERELVVVATSGANHCTYCVVAHGAILRIRTKDQHIADHVASNPWAAELTDRQRAIVDLALSLAVDSAGFGEHDVAVAEDAGLTRAEIWDIGAITAFFAMSNRLAHLMSLRPNDEFFLMGRVPRA
ncbi:peroxidase-related enzyme [Actinokineospora sp. NBRC 105648]|uniref:peroxidase-related enzyme n=1 Tax=Actinokineospora sp. NBRC 105648 TaxID=3032206 RepID=UPI00249F9EC3|nr:peroxidase-related enzyme [Actinokineospora sp. NBRC 105648]GLZ37475.1 alkyl hydroperoxide reductase AhpD [Actinokineospora sp. NBRC 105648]